MFRKKDAVLIVIVLAVAAAIYGLMLLARGGQSLSGQVAIYADGVLYENVPLGEAREVRVEQPDGAVNVVSIDASGVRMAFSSCKNQLCLQQGEVTADNWTRRAMGRTIICLPNHVVVELALDDGHPSLEDYDVPDI